MSSKNNNVTRSRVILSKRICASKFLRSSFHLYVSTGRAIAVTTASVSTLASASVLLKMLKFFIKVFKILYLLNPWMDLVGTLPDIRYWSDVLCCTITTHIDDLEVKVTDFEILSYSFWLKFLFKVFGSLYLLKL